jgi:hypothetical protein
MSRRQAEFAAWVLGGVGLFGTVIGSWIVSPGVFSHAWLAALSVWIGWPIGCMGLLLIHALTGGRWGEVTRPHLVAGMITLPLLVPALIPLLGVLSTLYPWMRPDVALHLDNRFYLNPPFFFGRVIFYLVVWFGLAGLILRALRQNRSETMLARIAPFGLILLAITVTYAAIDTTMSLDPHFVSSVYGLIEIAEMGLLALSVSVLAAAIGSPPDASALRNLGQLLLGLVLLWAYLDFMQVLIVWQSDLATEAPWYILRSTGGWGVAAAVVAAGHFVLPFFALIWPQVQRSRFGIASVAVLLVLSAVVHGWWLVVPASGRGFGPVDVLAMLGLLGIAVAFALRAPLLPMMPEAMRRHA